MNHRVSLALGRNFLHLSRRLSRAVRCAKLLMCRDLAAPGRSILRLSRREGLFMNHRVSPALGRNFLHWS